MVHMSHEPLLPFTPAFPYGSSATCLLYIKVQLCLYIFNVDQERLILIWKRRMQTSHPFLLGQTACQGRLSDETEASLMTIGPGEGSLSTVGEEKGRDLSGPY